MFSKQIIAACVMMSVSFLPAKPAEAGSDALGGLIVGGIVGAAIANSHNKRTTRRSGGSSVTRAANRETQTSLNYFGFPAGTPDGVMGRRSRTAISSYQIYMGFPATGQLQVHERDFLVNSYNRAIVGGANTAELIAESQDGVRGLLVAYRGDQAGGSSSGTYAGRTIGGLPKEVSASVFEIAKSSDPTAQQLIQRSGFVQLADLNNDGQTDYILDTSVTGSAFWCNAQNCAVRVFVSIPEGYQRNDFQAFNVTPAMFTCQRGECSKANAPATMMVAAPVAPQTPQVVVAAAQPVVRSVVPAATAPAATLALPSFMGATTTTVSLASHCNQVSLLTSSNGGFVTEASMSDAGFALNEQFCLARTYAIANGEKLASKLAGVTNAQLEQQCAVFGPAMKSEISALSLKPRAQVLQDVSSFVLKTGMAPEQLSGTARICLSVGYRTDNLDVALGSALLLTVLGESAYGELLGHHLTQGYGASKRPDLGLEWFQASFDAHAAGGEAVFAPGDPSRNSLIRRAAFEVNGQGSMIVPANTPSTSATVLPVFSLGTGTDN